MSRTIEHVAEQLRDNQRNGGSCVLLIGAGCSVEAGIPGAEGFVREIKARYRRKYDSAPTKTYPACMAQLTSNERHDLISGFIDNAKINWAHIAIAQLMASGHVDRVLTTNFDPLVMRASALFNIFPAVYDMVTIGEEYRPSWVRDRAVFHLHGQRDGFFQAHTEEHVNALENRLSGLFRDCAQRRTWIVVGYSGDNDPVFRQLAKMPEFEHDLYWVTYKQDGMPGHLAPLIQQGKGGYWINDSLGADSFLFQLAAKVGCEEPPFYAKPFRHLRETLDTIASFKLPGQDSELEVTRRAIDKIDKAIHCIEPSLICRADGLEEAQTESPEDLAAKAQQLLMAGQYDDIIAMADQLPPTAIETLAWAYIFQGYDFENSAKEKSGPVAEDLFRMAYEKYAKAIVVKPNSHVAWGSWGGALTQQAQKTDGTKADDLFQQASEKCLQANAIKPGEGSYNLACIAALRGEPQDCRRWLEDCITHNDLPDRKHLTGDTDLDSVRNEPWFAEILAKAKE